MIERTMDFTADQMCFACGTDNPIGLRLTFHEEDDRYVTTFVADPRLQGYQQIVHGGIVATVLDEVMARYVWTKVGRAATAKLAIRYCRPVPTQEPIIVRGWITAERRGGTAFETAADARLGSDGTLLAEATGLIMMLPTVGDGMLCTP